MFAAAVLTVSDKGSAGKREDTCGPLIVRILSQAGYEIIRQEIIPDEQKKIEATLVSMADESGAALIITTGGTGFSPRDVTPEATIAVCSRLAPGIPEAMRAGSMQITDRAMLSRAAAGIRGQSLIVNLPGSPKAVRECLQIILPPLLHGLEILRGTASECAQKD